MTLIAGILPVETPVADDATTPPTSNEAGDRTRESQATAIVRLALEAGVDLWHTPTDDGYITFAVDGHREHHPLASRAARDYLTRLLYSDSGKAPNPTALKAAIDTLRPIARFDGDEHEVHVRVAGDDDDCVAYLDLCDPAWRAVQVTSTGWHVVNNPPVRFQRRRGMLPLPVPVADGSIEELRPFINVASDSDFCLMVTWLIQALRAQGPYPIQIVNAEQGAGKTTAAKVQRRLVDPSESDVRRPPRNTEDLMIAATNGHVVAFDNLSRLPEELSDNLSVLATGGGFAVRQLFTNREEEIFQAQRPIILNGISQVATRGDLIDRAIVISLPSIPEQARRDEATFWQAFNRARPSILGALLDAVSCGLRRLPDVHLDRKPRMADFALWSVAVEPACPWPDGTFLAAYTGNRQGAVEATLDGDPVADVARAIAPWSGTASELLAELTKRTAENITKRKEWFSKPRQVSDALRRLAPGLRKVGIEVTFARQANTGRRLVSIERVSREQSGSSSSPSSLSSPDPGSLADLGDEHGDISPRTSPCSSPRSAPVYGVRDDSDDSDAVKHHLSHDSKEADDGDLQPF